MFGAFEPISAQNTDTNSVCYIQAQDLYKQALEQIKLNNRIAYDLFEMSTISNPDFVAPYYYMGVLNVEFARKTTEDVEKIKQLSTSYMDVEKYYIKIKEYELLAEENFDMVFQLDSTFNRWMTFFWAGKQNYIAKNYDLAQQYLDIFIKHNTENCEELEMTHEFLTRTRAYFKLLNNPVPFSPKALSGVCTKNDEFLPVISPDGELLLFTTQFKQRSKYTGKISAVEKFQYSKRLTSKTKRNSRYSAGKSMPSPFNDGRNQGGATITLNSKELYITICARERIASTSYINCDIYWTKFGGGKWSALRKLSSNINNRSTWEAQPSITADGKILYFASDRKGGYGGYDIYYSERDVSGHWMPAKNVGPLINTPNNEKTPFIHTDSQTLYFASDGYFGMGGYDVYYSQYKGLGVWSKPKNLGFPINTEKDEVAYVVSSNGIKIFFSSNSLIGKGGWDIYSADLYAEARPKPVLFVKGEIEIDNKLDEEINPTDIQVQNMRTLKITKGLYEPETGQYAVAIAVLDPNDEFIISVKKRGYFFESIRIKPSDEDLSHPPKELDFELKKIEIGTVILLNYIYFETNSAEFDSLSIGNLNNFVEFLTLNSSLKISLNGHTDNVGDDKSNMILSILRAKAVRNYLIINGIKGDRVNCNGFGETRPVATNATKRGRAKNRRTEFVVTVK